eukprot:2864252-Rhodomonas_salina.2
MSARSFLVVWTRKGGSHMARKRQRMRGPHKSPVMQHVTSALAITWRVPSCCLLLFISIRSLALPLFLLPSPALPHYLPHSLAPSLTLLL